MPVFLALPLMVFSAWMAARAVRATRDASRVGQLRIFGRLHQRSQSNLFLAFALALTRFDIFFFVSLTVISGAFLLEALGFIQ